MLTFKIQIEKTLRRNSPPENSHYYVTLSFSSLSLLKYKSPVDNIVIHELACKCQTTVTLILNALQNTSERKHISLI